MPQADPPVADFAEPARARPGKFKTLTAVRQLFVLDGGTAALGK